MAGCKKKYNNDSIRAKLVSLEEDLKRMKKVALAFSGGVDSAFLLKITSEVLTGNVIAITIKSAAFPESEFNTAVSLADYYNVRHIVLEGKEINNPDFIKNDKLRCYFCKKVNFREIINIASENNISFVIDGQNYDDEKDYRPGAAAAKELGILSPLKDCKLSKKDIRYLSREMEIPGWDRPSSACLASRIAYGIKIDEHLLKRIGYLEGYLAGKGFKQVRVRHHDNMARIEIVREDFLKLMENKLNNEIISEFKASGYDYITLDLEGYRTGSMNLPILSGKLINYKIKKI